MPLQLRATLCAWQCQVALFDVSWQNAARQKRMGVQAAGWRPYAPRFRVAFFTFICLWYIVCSDRTSVLFLSKIAAVCSQVICPYPWYVRLSAIRANIIPASSPTFDPFKSEIIRCLPECVLMRLVHSTAFFGKKVARNRLTALHAVSLFRRRVEASLRWDGNSKPSSLGHDHVSHSWTHPKKPLFRFLLRFNGFFLRSSKMGSTPLIMCFTVAAWRFKGPIRTHSCFHWKSLPLRRNTSVMRRHSKWLNNKAA